MFIDLNKSVPELPSVRLFTERILTDLNNKRSVIVLLPCGIEPEWIVSKIRLNMFYQNSFYEEITLLSNNSYNNCTRFLGRALGLEDEHGYLPESPHGLF